MKNENVMRTIKIEKLVLGTGGTADDCEKGYKLLEMLTGRKPIKTRAKRRIPSLGVRPNLEIGAIVTIRKNIEPMLKKMLVAVDNILRKKQVTTNHFSFGIKEYIEIPGTEYNREIGIKGLDVTIVFKRSGRRVRLRKMKAGKFSKRQSISKEEIIKFMEDNFQTKFK